MSQADLNGRPASAKIAWLPALSAGGTPAVEGKSGIQSPANLAARHRIGRIWHWLFQASTIVGIIALTTLLYTVVVQSFGLVAMQDVVDPASLAVNGVPLEQLSQEKLAAILAQHVSAGVIRRLESEKPFAERSREEMYALVVERVVKPEVVASWSLGDSLLQRPAILAEMAQAYPGARLEWRAWLNVDFLRHPQSSTPELAGVRTALLGSLWTIMITILIAFPVGVGAAIYLEEYARDNVVNRTIQTNINNLAGVPSIIYGMLGLALFVRVLEPLTSGVLLGVAADPTTANGRTILSAALTLALLVLPLLIINAQEAMRAVPRSLRDASYGLGATHWQTIWHHVLPNALPGILTGTILAISRAIGETAPLVVVGAATFIAVDPSGPFSKFTTLPIQIYQWTSRPQDQFRNIAAAAIIVLLILLLALNASAILLRNRYSRRLS
jgi:phosphate transport system permease protein